MQIGWNTASKAFRDIETDRFAIVEKLRVLEKGTRSSISVTIFPPGGRV